MEPNTVAQPNTAAAQPQQLDPSVVALTKAIGQAESGGNYNAPSGDSGSPSSAYQFTPGFIDKWAPQILGSKYQQGNYNLTPEQQDELAYGAVKTMGTTGDPGYQHLGKLNPAQIASAWNAGDPNAYLDPEYGKNNAYGSTQNYVEKVKQNYEKDMGDSAQSNPLGLSIANVASGQSGNIQTSSSQPGILDWLLGLGAAGVGYIAGNAKNILPLAGTAIGGLAGPEGAAVGGAIGETIAGNMGGGNQTPPSGENPQSTPQPDILSELAALNKDAPQINQAIKELYDTQQEALGTTIGGRQMIQDPQVQAGMQTNAKYGLNPLIDETGSMNWQPAMQKSQQTIGNLANQMQEVLLAEGNRAPMAFAIEEAKKQLRETTPSHEWEEGDREIERTAKQYEGNFSDGKGNMSLGHYQLMKQELGHGKKWNILETTAKKQAHKALSTAARRTIEHHTQHKELYNRVMKEEQKLINGQKIMKRLNGKKAPHNKGLLRHLFQRGGQYVGLAIGDKIGGPLGAVLGSMVGDYVTKSVDRKYGKTIFETPAMHKALLILQKQNPAVYRILEHELRKGKITYPQKRKTAKAILRKHTPRKPEVHIRPKVQFQLKSKPKQSEPQSK